MVSTYPNEVSTFRVKGRLVRGIADSADEGLAPDVVPIPGALVTFTPTINPPIFRVATAAEPIVVFQESVVATTDAEGYLQGELEADQGIVLAYGGNPLLVPTGWGWRVSISVGGNFPILEFVIAGSAGGVVDLASVVPVPPNPGDTLNAWTQAVVATQAARDQAIAARNAAVAVGTNNDTIMAAVLANPNSAFSQALEDKLDTSDGGSLGTRVDTLDALVGDNGRLSFGGINNTIRLFNRKSIMLRDYAKSTQTREQNRVAYQQAINDAQVENRTLCYDGAFFDFEGDAVRSVSQGLVHWATGIDTHKVSHLTPNKGPLRVAGRETLLEELNFDGKNPGLTGLIGQNANHSVAIFVEPTAHDTVVSGGWASGFKAGVFGTVGPYDLLADPNTNAASIPDIMNPDIYPALRNLRVERFHGEGLWAAFIPQAVDHWYGEKITGWYQKMPQSGSEAHLVYATAVGTRYGMDGTLDDSLSTGGDERHAFRIRGQRGFKGTRLRARDTPGLIQVLECEDVELGDGLFSYDDKLNGNDGSGSISIDTSKRVRQAPAVVQFKDGHVAPPGGSVVASEDVEVRRISVIDRSPSTNPVTTSAMYKLVGVNPRVRVIEPDLRAVGAGEVPIGLMISSNGQGNPVPSVEDPKILGNMKVGMRVSLPGSKVIYTPGDIQGNTRQFQFDDNTGGVLLVNRLAGVRQDLDASISATHTGEVTSSTTTNVGSKWSNGQSRAFVNGTWEGNPALGQINNAAGGLSITAVALASADADISVEVKRGSTTRAGIAIRTLGNTDTLALVLTATGVELVKYSGGITTPLASAAVPFPGKAFGTLRAIVVGTRIVGLLNGNQVIDFTLDAGDGATYIGPNFGAFVLTSSSPKAYFQKLVTRALV